MKFTLLPGIRVRDTLTVYVDHIEFIEALIKQLTLRPFKHAYSTELRDAIRHYVALPKVTRIKEMVYRLNHLLGNAQGQLVTRAEGVDDDYFILGQYYNMTTVPIHQQPNVLTEIERRTLMNLDQGSKNIHTAWQQVRVGDVPCTRNYRMLRLGHPEIWLVEVPKNWMTLKTAFRLQKEAAQLGPRRPRQKGARPSDEGELPNNEQTGDDTVTIIHETHLVI